MRERLMITLVAMTAVVLIVFGTVRAYSTTQLVHEQERESVSEAADLAAAAISVLGDRPVTEEFLTRLTGDDRSISYVDRTGTTVQAGPPGTDDDLVVTRTVAGGRMTFSQEASTASERVSRALVPLVLLGLGLLGFAAVTGFLLARRFAHPFRRLADDATQIGNGRFDVPVHRSSIREAAELGDALQRAAGQLDVLVRRERELAVVASHELRTPLTALRLSLEDLTMWPQTPPDVAAELQHSLAEVDRLSGVVTTLLEGGGAHRGEAVDIDLSVVAAEAVERWAARAKVHGRQVVLVPSETAMATVVRGPVDRIIDILVDNALVHGEGTVSIEAVSLDNHLRLRVTDEGPRAFETGVVHVSPAGPEAGLTEAATQAHSLGGFVAVADEPTTGVALILPHAD